MAFNYGRTVSRKQTPQSEPIPGKTQVENRGGGFVYAVDDWAQLERFVILGAESGSYYASARELTRQNAAAVERCWASDPVRTARTIGDISTAGRAPKNDPAIFALALGAASTVPAVRVAAYRVLSEVCRIPTHLFHFVAYLKELSNPQARSFRRAVAQWYNSRDSERLAYHLVKYQGRDGWTHRDVLRLAHPKPIDEEHDKLFGYACKGLPEGWTTENLRTARCRAVAGFELAKRIEPKELPAIIRQFQLTREMVPTEALREAVVWEALLETMPMGAMVRNLGKMTAVGLLGPLSTAAKEVTARLADTERIHASRLHPLTILVALKIYAQGHGEKGKLSWEPVQSVVDALDESFYLAFGNVKPTGKRLMLALDVSGSMTMSKIAGMPITPREGAAAMAMVAAHVEPRCVAVAFTGPSTGSTETYYRDAPPRCTPFALSKRRRLDDVMREMATTQAGPTDCAQPMLYALRNKLEVDAFCVYTDNETWCGGIHPSQALADYRRQTGIQARLVAVGMTAEEYSIADPADAGMLDVVGFDTAAPSVIGDFVRQPCPPTPSFKT